MQLPSTFNIHIMYEKQFSLCFSIPLVHCPTTAAGAAGTVTVVVAVYCGAVAVCVPRCHQQLGASRHGGHFTLKGLVADSDGAQLGILRGGREVLDHAAHRGHCHFAALLFRLTWKQCGWHMKQS